MRLAGMVARKLLCGLVQHNLNPFFWMSPVKESLQSPLLYNVVPKYGSFHQYPTPEAFSFLLVLRHL